MRIPADVGTVTAPVWLTIGDPATGAQPERIGDVRVDLRVDTELTADGRGLAFRAVSTDPGAIRAQVADVLDAAAAKLRAPETAEEVPADAAPE